MKIVSKGTLTAFSLSMLTASALAIGVGGVSVGSGGVSVGGMTSTGSGMVGAGAAGSGLASGRLSNSAGMQAVDMTGQSPLLSNTKSKVRKTNATGTATVNGRTVSVNTNNLRNNAQSRIQSVRANAANRVNSARSFVNNSNVSASATVNGKTYGVNSTTLRNNAQSRLQSTRTALNNKVTSTRNSVNTVANNVRSRLDRNYGVSESFSANAGRASVNGNVSGSTGMKSVSAGTTLNGRTVSVSSDNVRSRLQQTRTAVHNRIANAQSRLENAGNANASFSASAGRFSASGSAKTNTSKNTASSSMAGAASRNGGDPGEQ